MSKPAPVTPPRRLTLVINGIAEPLKPAPDVLAERAATLREMRNKAAWERKRGELKPLERDPAHRSLAFLGSPNTRLFAAVGALSRL